MAKGNNKRVTNNGGHGGAGRGGAGRGAGKRQKTAEKVSAAGTKTNSNGQLMSVAGVSGPPDENVLNNVRKEPDAAGGKVGEAGKVNIAFMGDSKPKTVKELSNNMERLLRQTVDDKIFPYTKFFKQDSELENTGLLYMAFRNVGFIKNNHEDDAKRGKYWKAFVEFIKTRINDRRSAIVAAVKKAAIGK